MALDWVIVVFDCISLIAFLVISPILVKYCIILFKNTKATENPETTVGTSHNAKTYNASKCGMVCFLIACISDALMFIVVLIQYFITEERSLPLAIILWDAFNVLAYGFGIWIMLFTFLLRIHYAFNNSFLDYSKWLIMALYALIFLTFITVVMAVITYRSGHEMMGWIAFLCVAEIVIYDVTLLYLLFQKLFRLFIMRGVQNIEDTETDSQSTPPIIELNTLETTTRYAALILLGIVSTLVPLIVLSLKAVSDIRPPGGALVALDIYVNATCLFLMFAVNKEKYNKCCGKYHSCLQTCCINCTYKGTITSKKTKQEYIGLVLADSVAL